MNNFTKNLLETKVIFGDCQKRLKQLLVKPVVIYGAGTVGKLFLGLCYDPDISLLAVCDKNKKNEPCPLVGKIIDFLEVVDKFKGEFQVIIASQTYYDEIREYVIQYVSEEDIIDVSSIYSMIPICHTLKPMQEYREYVETNHKDIDMVAGWLEDEESRNTLEAMILARLSWNIEYFNDVKKDIQYFDPDIINLEKDEVLIDGGAFIGDTLEHFVKLVNGQFCKIYCFEPGDEQYEKLKMQADKYENSEKIILIKKALLDKNTIVYFRIDGSGSCITKNDENEVIEVACTTIDDVTDDRVSLIKMDVEGSELEALKGAERVIRRFKPKLMICVYHKPEDIIEIPKYIESLNLGYKFYLRHYCSDMNESVLYAI
jgi:FkbM family methyltransferase